MLSKVSVLYDHIVVADEKLDELEQTLQTLQLQSNVSKQDESIVQPKDQSQLKVKRCSSMSEKRRSWYL